MAFSVWRIVTTFDMSTSIALVTCAAVSSERRMCSAMPRRIALIGAISSRRAKRLRRLASGLRRRGTAAQQERAPGVERAVEPRPAH